MLKGAALGVDIAYVQRMAEQVIIGDGEALPARSVSVGAFAYEKRILVPKEGNQLHVSFMEIPPGKSAFPYHWHEGITEAFVILSGTGVVRTPSGEHAVKAGDVVVFPPGAAGAHRITNTTAAETLRYVDLDTTSRPDVMHYPDSGKTAISGGSAPPTVWRDEDTVDYFDRE